MFLQDQGMTTFADNDQSSVLIAGLGLRLRPWTDADLPVMVELFDDPQFDRWTPLCAPFDLEAARGYLAKGQEARDAGRLLQLAITTDGRIPLGEVLLIRKNENGILTGELAYGLGVEHQGRGLASRAVRLMTAHAYDVFGVQQVILRIDPENTPSQRVARATGFHLTAAEPVIRERPDGRRVSLDTWIHPGVPPAGAASR